MLNYPNSDAAAALLSNTYTKILIFLRHLKRKYHISETEEEVAACSDHAAISSTRKYKAAYNILTRFDPDTIKENYPGIKSGTSFTLEKGKAMYLCVRQVPDATSLVDKDVLLFVVLHEIAHIGAYDEWQHGLKFWSTFKFLLQEAVEAGIYHPANYAELQPRYCSMTITYQPLTDDNIADLNSYAV